jgi:four helix bundle protein
MKDFWELDAWKRAHALSRWVFALICTHPELARYGLAPPMRSAGIAVAANIAEGCGAYGNNDGHWHFNVALGSLSSLDYLVFLAFEHELIADARVQWFIAIKIDIQERLRALLSEKETETSAPASLTLVQ